MIHNGKSELQISNETLKNDIKSHQTGFHLKKFKNKRLEKDCIYKELSRVLCANNTLLQIM